MSTEVGNWSERPEGRTRTHRENVEPRAEVQHDGDIPVPCCLFLGKPNHRDGLALVRGRVSDAFSNIVVVFNGCWPFGGPSYPVEIHVSLPSASSRNVDAVHDPEAMTTRSARIEDPSASVTPRVRPSSSRTRPTTVFPRRTFPPNAITRAMSISMARAAAAQPASRLWYAMAGAAPPSNKTPLVTPSGKIVRGMASTESYLIARTLRATSFA